MGTKYVVQETLETPRGVRLFIPQVEPTYSQKEVVKLYERGLEEREIAFWLSVDPYFVCKTIEEYAQ